MEFITPNSSPQEMADALRGCHGKKVEKDASFVYLGQAVIGIGKSTEVLNKHCGVPHYEWHQLSPEVFFAILR